MIVISDTSPLNYLILIECIDVLPQLYGRVVIPEGVLPELQRDSTPQVVKKWMAARPDWLDIRQVRLQPDERLATLGVGERQAISLAQELRAAAIIIDEERGRQEAKRLGLSVIGILGVLRDAAERNLIELPFALDRLRETNFRVSEKIIQSLLRPDADRNHQE
jgi:predicted nucleic acid-binding protein